MCCDIMHYFWRLFSIYVILPGYCIVFFKICIVYFLLYVVPIIVAPYFLASESLIEDKGPQRGDLPQIRFQNTPKPIVAVDSEYEDGFLSQELLDIPNIYS